MVGIRLIRMLQGKIAMLFQVISALAITRELSTSPATIEAIARAVLPVALSGKKVAVPVSDAWSVAACQLNSTPCSTVIVNSLVQVVTNRRSY